MNSIKIFKHRLNRIKHRLNRFRSHSLPIVKRVTLGMDILTFIAAFLTIVSIIILAGYENDRHTLSILHRITRISHVAFIVNVLYNIVFTFKLSIRRTRRFRWILDMLVLSTLLPLMYPRPEHPWLPWLDHILYSSWFSYSITGVYASVILCTGIISVLGRRTNPSVILGSSFLFFIMLGSFLLMMPRCTTVEISYVDSLFVSTSAVSITGLSPIDISATFTPLGLLILALLIQIGGLGVLTFTSFFALFFSGNTSIYSQLMVRDMVYTRTMNNLLPTLLYILVFTLSIELIGAVAIFICIHDTLDMSLGDELIFSAFHSLTAFMNAGFSNIEGGLSNPMLLHSNQSIYIVASILILAGGIGFPILVNLKTAAGRYLNHMARYIWHDRIKPFPTHLYDVNTKIVLWSTLILFAASSLLFFLFEHDNSLKGMTIYEQIVQSVFNSFVPRSSGFASVSPSGFLNITLIMMIVLMWIGGASQSTAGGIKVNTLAAVLLNLRSITMGKHDVVAFGRRISINSIRRANAVITLSILSLVSYTFIVVALEPELPLKSLFYETVSALFTVGSSLGVTDQLGDWTKIVLCTAMFIGRVGLLSLLMGLAYSTKNPQVKYPAGDIIIN